MAKMNWFLLLFCCFLWVGFGQYVNCYGDTLHYPSGLLRSYSTPQPHNRYLDEERAVTEFLEKYAEPTSSDFNWHERRKFSDNTHTHFLYELYFKNLRVADHFMKIHYNRNGWVEYASSNWNALFELDIPRGRLRPSKQFQSHFEKNLRSSYGIRPTGLEFEPVVWVVADGSRAWYAYETRVLLSGMSRRFYVDGASGKVLSEKHLTRGYSNEKHLTRGYSNEKHLTRGYSNEKHLTRGYSNEKHLTRGYFNEKHLTRGYSNEKHPVGRYSVSNRVYKSSPYGTTNVSETNLVTLEGLDSVDALSNGYFRVRRQVGFGTSGNLVDIDPDTVFANAAGFSLNPLNDNHECNDEGPGECPNQGFNGVNVYYQFYNFRMILNSYFAELGIDESTFSRDPIDVIVNLFSYDADKDGQQDDANNAFFYEGRCTSEEDASSACIVFMRPEPVNDPACNGVAQFYDLAREAIVVSHEYQHYITDTLANLTSGGDSHVVGDALHEGYSDYFGSSFVTYNNNNVETALIGKYAFKDCSAYQRDVSVLRVYQDDQNYASFYSVGLTWASGLWELRDTVGVSDMDKLVLKSLTFLPTNAGYADAVESLVKADKALYSGEHVETIRSLYYERLDFYGGLDIGFRDVGRGIVEVGFKSCSSVLSTGTNGTASFFVWVFWLVTTCARGRVKRRADSRKATTSKNLASHVET